MALKTSIEWTDTTWNPVTGCTKISAGCKHCYAERMAMRLQKMGCSGYEDGFNVTLQPHMLGAPLKWKKPRTVFVNSMGDLFHEYIPLSYIQKVFDVMRRASRHRFQVLTKRSEHLTTLDVQLKWTPNIWMGVSVETDKYRFRIEDLRKNHAYVKFLSFEPLLGPLPNLNLKEIDWVIVGGESGPSARPMKKEWVIDIRDQCINVGVPFFFKQWGGTNKKKAGRLLEDRTWDEMPTKED